MNYYTEAQAKAFAEYASKSIVAKINPNNDGAGEIRRESTKKEASIIESIVYGCLLAIKENIGNDNRFIRSGHISGAKSSAEFIFGITTNWAYNGYLTIYFPITEFLILRGITPH